MNGNKIELLSQKKIESIGQEINNKCVKLKGILEYILSVEHEDIHKNTQRLQKQLQDETIYSDYFNPCSFKSSMYKLKNIITKESTGGHIENIDIILGLFCDVTQPAFKWIILGYNKNLKSKPGKFYEKFCICLFQIDDIAECLRRLSCGHQYNLSCVKEWFETY